VFGAVILIIWPPLFYFAASSWNNLLNKDLSSALMTIFKSLPGVLSTILYISASSLRCIIRVDENESVVQQCGNPIFPTFLITVLLAFIWLSVYVFFPIAKHKREYTWVDVLKLKFDRMEGIQFAHYGLLSVLALVLFSLTEEDGSKLEKHLVYLCGLFLLPIWSLIFLTIYDIIIKPSLFPSSTIRPSSLRSSGVVSLVKDSLPNMIEVMKYG